MRKLNTTANDMLSTFSCSTFTKDILES